MRIVGFVVGVLGALAAGGLGAKWLSDAAPFERELQQAKALGLDPGSIVTAGYFLLLSLILGVIGSVWILQRRRTRAAVALAVAGVLPAVFEPKALVCTWLLVVAAALAMAVKPSFGKVVTP